MRQEIHKCYTEVCASHRMFAPLLLGGVRVVLKKTLGLIKVFYSKVNNKNKTKKHITTNNKKKTSVKWKNTNLVILEPNPSNKKKQESYIFIKSN